MPTPEQIAAEAKAEYIKACEEAGTYADPVLADILYTQALRAAQGRIYFAGD